MEWEKWKLFSASELENYYSPSNWHPYKGPDEVINDHIRQLELESEKSYKTVPCRRNLSYGESKREVVDIFAEELLPADAPVYCFIHGGYWQMMSHSQYALDAQKWTDAGVVLCLVEYDLAPAVTVTQIVQQTKKALQFLIELFKQRGSRGIYLGGHSAGGQLVSMLLADETIMESNFIKGAIIFSAVIDLEPLIFTSDNKALQLTLDEAIANSPRYLVKQLATLCANIPIIILVGEHDSPEYIRQSKEYYEALLQHNAHVRLVIADGMDHYDLMWCVQSLVIEMIKLN